jgi:hypothetical protein
MEVQGFFLLHSLHAPMQWVPPALSPGEGVKLPGREADHSRYCLFLPLFFYQVVKSPVNDLSSQYESKKCEIDWRECREISTGNLLKADPTKNT